MANKILFIGVIVLVVVIAGILLLRKPEDNIQQKEDGNEDGQTEDEKDPYIYVPDITTPTGIYTGL